MKSPVLVSSGHNAQMTDLALGFSQEQLAEKACVPCTYPGIMERAEKIITLCNIEKIATALGVSIIIISKFFHK